MNVSVGTAETPIATTESVDSFAAGQVVIVQNLGPGTVYLGTSQGVTAVNGLELVPDAVYEFPRTANEVTFYAVSTQAATDVRVVLID